MKENLTMINISTSELDKFKSNYDTDINNSIDYLRIINQELNNLREFIDTPNIGKKIEEFNNEYNDLVKDINELSGLMSETIDSTIKVYQALTDSLKRGVGNEEL